MSYQRKTSIITVQTGWRKAAEAAVSVASVKFYTPPLKCKCRNTATAPSSRRGSSVPPLRWKHARVFPSWLPIPKQLSPWISGGFWGHEHAWPCRVSRVCPCAPPTPLYSTTGHASRHVLHHIVPEEFSTTFDDG